MRLRALTSGIWFSVLFWEHLPRQLYDPASYCGRQSMRLFWMSGLLIALCPWNLYAQNLADPVKLAISQGGLFRSKHKYELAQDAYRKADKASHHNSAEAYLKLAAVDRNLGDFSAAMDDAKKALKAAGDNKTWAIQAHLVHANLLVQTSSKPGD